MSSSQQVDAFLRRLNSAGDLVPGFHPKGDGPYNMHAQHLAHLAIHAVRAVQEMMKDNHKGRRQLRADDKEAVQALCDQNPKVREYLESQASEVSVGELLEWRAKVR